jgi:hypothetical protein
LVRANHNARHEEAAAMRSTPSIATILPAALAAVLFALPCGAQTQPEKPKYVGVAVVELFTSEG